MHLDLQTLFIIQILVNTLFFALFTVISISIPHIKGLGKLGLLSLLFIPVFILFQLQGKIDPFFTIILANTLNICFLSILLSAMDQILDRKRTIIFYVLPPAVLIILFPIFLYGYNSYHIRTILSILMQIYICVMIIESILNSKFNCKPAVLPIVIGVNIFLILLYLFRIVSVYLFTGPQSTYAPILYWNIVMLISLINTILTYFYALFLSMIIIQNNLENNLNELKLLRKTRERMIAILSHDLRSPLTSIRKVIGIVLTRKQLLPEDYEIMNAVYTASDNMVNLTQNMLEWSKNQRDTAHPTIQPFTPDSIILESIHDNRFSADLKNIKINSSLGKAFILNTDKNIVRFVLRNILNNAVKFTYEGGKIDISLTHEGLITQITIEDNGTGFTPSAKPSMKGTANETGTGLGISISKELLHTIQGSLTIESAISKGTRVTITLPDLSHTRQ